MLFKKAELKGSVTVIRVLRWEKQQEIYWSFAAICAPPQVHVWWDQPGADSHKGENRVRRREGASSLHIPGMDQGRSHQGLGETMALPVTRPQRTCT